MKTELLSPAGTLKHMRYAFAYGADAVYAGQPRYSLRVRNNEFDLENLAIGIQEAHRLGKQFYIASNIAPHNKKVHSYLKDIEPVIAMKPDALIMSDPGLIMLVKEKWPEIPIHLSVQANVVNYAAAQFWYKQGVERIILSRELSLDEIEEIRMRVPELELEVFVHGALCIAYSGRCLLSGYINKRDPNQGTCTNACRWKYSATPAKETNTGDVIAKSDTQIWTPQPTLGDGATTNDIFLLEEEGRPGETMAAFEDEHGTYIMNSKDLRAIQHVKRLVDMGIHSLKIEGRTKSHYYAARTAQTYRQAIDDAIDGRDFDIALMDQLEALSNRGYTEGFYRRHVHDEYQNYERGTSDANKQLFVGEVIQNIHPEYLTIDVKNRFEEGDRVELMTPQGNYAFTLSGMLNTKQEPKHVAQGSGVKVLIPKPKDFSGSANAMEYALLMKELHT
ncbi:tRNA 5-hydroxyuridine modification protein YegQ [Bermanella marisrubri]|uniref:Peptidase, U32 family protein n=1 Tax=Bermanella marisrubri TaxID=207949 RepID=Q1N0R0_9GAMM|nr:tRNA 5-hydroxyuridine modification protein YegQ [Bermanella marisrubri]EAT11773.1 peptidase, U32 family protein [Oceanobacter sp. RED65] [Bermanella marisrubri]QIZ83808.1 tRNA 5-hydroxyuridine modification protein YegQ [Bermanella marisrubri]